MSKKKSFTFEYETPEGDRITIIRDEEETRVLIDEETLPQNTIDTWQNIASGVVREETGQDISPDTIDVWGIYNPMSLRECSKCNESISNIRATYCPYCANKL